jgi:xanthine dehydrogenase YagT iron-sulfur-binding subunit
MTELRNGNASVVTPDLVRTQIAITDDELRERMSGNICRCGAYNGIIAAIEEVRGKRA